MPLSLFIITVSFRIVYEEFWMKSNLVMMSVLLMAVANVKSNMYIAETEDDEKMIIETEDEDEETVEHEVEDFQVGRSTGNLDVSINIGLANSRNDELLPWVKSLKVCPQLYLALSTKLFKISEILDTNGQKLS